MTTLELIELIVIGVIAITLSIYYLVKAIKNKWIGKISTAIVDACKEAEEKFGPGKGSEKKAYVLSKIEDVCAELGIPYAVIAKLISMFIDKVIANYNGMKR